MATTINVYLDNGLVFSYDVGTPNSAREHAAAIATTGYRHTDNDAGVMEHYPPHRIVKIKCVGGMKTSYPDETRGT